MKSFVALFALVAVVAADVSHLRNPESDAQILRQEADVFPDQYHYSFETSNGIAAEERGIIKNAGREDEGLEVEGANSYTAPSGERIAISFIANENGYQPKGDHLPTTPAPQPIPDYILRSLQYIKEHQPTTDRQ